MITSYDIATRDVETLQLVHWDRLLLDEAQDVKNPQTRRARSLRLLRARRRVAMTGTPIENHLGELWAIMDLLNPGLLGSREWFHRAFVEPIQIDDDPEALERLRAIVRPFILRRRKDDPGGRARPAADHDAQGLLPADAGAGGALPAGHRLVAAARRGARRPLRPARRGARDARPAEAGVQPPGDGAARRRPARRAVPGSSSASSSCCGSCRSGDKALVFTQYTSFAGLVPHLAERLDKRVEFFHGSLNAAQREELLTAFASPGGPSVLVVSLRAGGRGLNLPAANHVFHFDRWWNPAVEQQASDRAHRLGQEKPVWVHSLITSGHARGPDRPCCSSRRRSSSRR